MEDFFNSVDKLKHMGLSAVLVVFFKVISELINPFGGLINTLFAGILTLLIGAIKEVADHYIEERVSSWKDFLADVIGTMSTMVPLMFI